MSARVAHADDPKYLKAAFSVLGLSEIAGEEDEPQILAMYVACGHPEVVRDEVAWCAAYVGWCLHRGGLPTSKPVNQNLLAASYVNYPGKKYTKDDTVPRGAICVWPRSEGSGHVNFALADLGEYVLCIGGNQGNGRGGGVTITKYSKDKLKAAIMPKGVSVPLPKARLPIEAPEPVKPPKTGVSEGAKAGAGLGMLGILSQIWDAIVQAPEQLLDVMVRAAQKPQFWIFVCVAGIGIYIWWQRRQMKKAEA